MKQLILALLLAAPLCSFETPNDTVFLKMEINGIKEVVIGKAAGEKYILTATADQLNSLFEGELKNNPTVKLVNFSINKDVVEGTKGLTYYYLKAANRNNTFKIAKNLN